MWALELGTRHWDPPSTLARVLRFSLTTAPSFLVAAISSWRRCCSSVASLRSFSFASCRPDSNSSLAFLLTMSAAVRFMEAFGCLARLSRVTRELSLSSRARERSSHSSRKASSDPFLMLSMRASTAASCSSSEMLAGGL
eukprot:CAMPEP_0169478804 /NCGR_PEP_ID=MMETSP1042-20121227/28670_1 /TAXON_ID=464988 /ORGANISM="Hemiselmis andersenii, Strain CCMP1180" /LENGTH=139 /DNA_ID=CAMNT_0009593295 /DNA_START=90 /DNA_END=509 /DNA_ORIENTATION=-